MSENASTGILVRKIDQINCYNPTMFAATRLRDNSYAKTARIIKQKVEDKALPQVPSTRNTQRIHLDSVIKKNYNDLQRKGKQNEESEKSTASIIKTMQLIDRSIEPIVEQHQSIITEQESKVEY